MLGEERPTDNPHCHPWITPKSFFFELRHFYHIQISSLAASSPLWSNCPSEKIMFFWTYSIFGCSLELLGMQLLFNWNQQPELAWIQSWAFPPQKCLLEPGDQGMGGLVIHLQVLLPGKLCLDLGTMLAQKTEFLFSGQKKMTCHSWGPQLSGSWGKCSIAQLVSVNVWIN